MKIGIVGLGLIGGSFAKAYKQNSDSRVFGYDIDASAVSYARLSETIDDTLTDENIGECDLIIIALYPGATIEFLREKSHLFAKGCLVIDTCGTKRQVCKVGFECAEKHGFVFAGGHPMAGTQFSGIKYSGAYLFQNASMIIVPPKFDDMALFERIKTALLPAKFGKITISTAENHDRMIAYTSQLAHVVSNAYVKSERAVENHGFSAGSYKDMTRVATLNEDMWTQLFMENSDNLSAELSELIDALTQYKKALDTDDKGKMFELLCEGTKCKKLADG